MGERGRPAPRLLRALPGVRFQHPERRTVPGSPQAAQGLGRATWSLTQAQGHPVRTQCARLLLPSAGVRGESIRRPREALKKSKQNVPGTHAGKTFAWNWKEISGVRGRARRFTKLLWPSAAFTQFNK